ncbi:MAG: right-handed parallel beta-helix repeat-containing protein [Planctomycetaceae bacterium]
MLTSIRARRGRPILNRLSALLDSLKIGSQRRRARQRSVQTALTSELLEQRTLLTGLIGIDLGGVNTPTNWTSFSGTVDTTLTNLTDESGTSTGVDVFVDVDSMPGNYDNFTPSAVPIHTQSLTGVDRMYFDVGGINFDFSNLTPNQNYEVYVFGGDSIADTQRVTITGATETQFSYMHGANQMFVNRELSDAGRTLESYAEIMESTASGTMTVRMDSAGGFDFNLMAVAIREVPSNTIFTVSSTADSGAGSLRQAILDANASTTPATIMFEIPNTDGGFVDVDNGSGLPGADADADVFRIQPLSGSGNLPALNNVNGHPITIDGLSQATFGGDTNPNGPEIEIDGSLFGANGHGLIIDGDNVTVQGFAVNNFSVLGILVTGDGDVVSGNYVGTDATGRSAAPNTVHGIQLSGAMNATIGGTTVAEGNLISGNTGTGLFVSNTSQNVLIQGNLIGTDATGASALGNGGGLAIDNASMVSIDGTVLPNVISGNAGDGVSISNLSHHVMIAGNRIGVDAQGTSALGNGGIGISSVSSDFIKIGGPSAAERNIVSDNGGRGVFLWTGHDLSVENNFIGTDLTGTVAFGNGSSGLHLQDSQKAEILDNVIGDSAFSGIRLENVGIDVQLVQWPSGDGGNDHYFFLTPNRFWGEADAIATAAGGYLASINSQDENDFLTTTFGSASPWIGFNDIATEGTFVWTSGEPTNFANFGPGEPNGGAAENFVQLLSNGFWNDLGGSAKHQAIIEFETLPDINAVIDAIGRARVQGNTIGTDLAGTLMLGNTQGIQVDGSHDVLIGGTGDPNLIAFNSDRGINIAGTSGRVTVSENSIHSNSQLGIDLDGDGLTPNDLDDSDMGPNGLQNFPILSGFNSDDDLFGSLQSTANTMFTIEIFDNNVVDPADAEGETFLTSFQVMTDVTGFAAFGVSPGMLPTALTSVTATATDPAGNTSEFSPAVGPATKFVDNADPGYSTDGTWAANSNVLARGGDIGNSLFGRGQNVARWSFSDLVPGRYRISATWVEHPNRATNSPFKALDSVGGMVLNSTVVNQELAPNDFADDGTNWEDLFIVDVTGSTLVVELSNAANQYVVADAIRIEPTLAPISPVAHIIDDGDPGFSTVGTWNLPAGMLGRENDLQHNAAGTGTDTATWTFTGLTPGNYIVSATWLEHINRATDAPFTIFDGTGGPVLEIVRVNQELAPDDFTDRGSNWEELAIVGITGSELVVQLSDDANGYVIADAIRIEQTMLPPLPQGTIIDDGDAGFATTIGWNAPASGLGRDGDLRNAASGDGSKVATWTFSGLTPGDYQVAATWFAYTNRATDAPFSILDGTGGPTLATVDVNQQLAPDDFSTFGSDWENLITVTITGTELVVELSNDADGYVIADAVRIQMALMPF